jgi:hypothetical protein
MYTTARMNKPARSKARDIILEGWKSVLKYRIIKIIDAHKPMKRPKHPAHQVFFLQ